MAVNFADSGQSGVKKDGGNKKKCGRRERKDFKGLSPSAPAQIILPGKSLGRGRKQANCLMVIFCAWSLLNGAVAKEAEKPERDWGITKGPT